MSPSLAAQGAAPAALKAEETQSSSLNHIPNARGQRGDTQPRGQRGRKKGRVGTEPPPPPPGAQGSTGGTWKASVPLRQREQSPFRGATAEQIEVIPFIFVSSAINPWEMEISACKHGALAAFGGLKSHENIVKQSRALPGLVESRGWGNAGGIRARGGERGRGGKGSLPSAPTFNLLMGFSSQKEQKKKLREMEREEKMGREGRRDAGGDRSACSPSAVAKKKREGEKKKGQSAALQPSPSAGGNHASRGKFI